ncbi:hypothetical protein EV177_010549, partial [Coemansia sp. RSA 1804]
MTPTIDPFSALKNWLGGTSSSPSQNTNVGNGTSKGRHAASGFRMFHAKFLKYLNGASLLP